MPTLNPCRVPVQVNVPRASWVVSVPQLTAMNKNSFCKLLNNADYYLHLKLDMWNKIRCIIIFKTYDVITGNINYTRIIIN